MAFFTCLSSFGIQLFIWMTCNAFIVIHRVEINFECNELVHCECILSCQPFRIWHIIAQKNGNRKLWCTITDHRVYCPLRHYPVIVFWLVLVLATTILDNQDERPPQKTWHYKGVWTHRQPLHTVIMWSAYCPLTCFYGTDEHVSRYSVLSRH
jgi:hypothetical protein